MPSSYDLTVEGKAATILTNKSSPEHSTTPEESPSDGSSPMVPKLPMVRGGRPRPRARRNIVYSSSVTSSDIPCSWGPSSREMLEDRESVHYLKMYGTRSGLHLPDINDKSQGRLGVRGPITKPVHMNTTSDDPLTLPSINITNSPMPRPPSVPRPPSLPRGYQCPALQPPAARSPRDISTKSPCDICDPAREYRDNCFRDYEVQVFEPHLPPLPMLPILHIQSPPGAPLTPEYGRRPPRHLPPLHLRRDMPHMPEE